MPQFPASTMPRLAVLALLAMGGAAPAAPPTMGRPDHETAALRSYLEDYSQPAWKQPSWWWRARKAAPAEQLAYGKEQANAGNLRRARAVFEELVHTWPSAPEAAEAQLALARVQEARGRKRDAFRELQYAILMYPNAIPYDKAVAAQMALVRDMEGELGTGFLGWGASMDAEGVAELYRIVAANVPAGDIAPECFFRMGEVLSGEHCRKYDLALTPYETLASLHPESGLVPAAAYGATRCRVLLARKYPRDGKRLRSAADSIAYVLANHAGRLDDASIADLQAWRAEIDAAIAHADYERAAFYDTIRRKPDAAAAAYRRFLELHPDSGESPRVRERLAEIEGSLPPPADSDSHRQQPPQP